MALLLALDESSSWCADLFAGPEHEGTEEERALVTELRADDGFATFDRRDAAGPGIDVAGLVDGLAGAAQASELVLLAERPVDPTPQDGITRLQRLDRVAALLASYRDEALLDVASAQASDQLLVELHVEHEVAVGRRTSRYSAGRSIEKARALATAFPCFVEALRAGEVSEGHCSVLVERTRVVSDPAALAEVARRALPKARRMTVGELGKELAAIIADVDPDAAARHRRARESRRVWTRPLDDGLSFLGLVHDTATVDAVKASITADALVVRAAARADRRDRAAAEVAAAGAGTADGGVSLQAVRAHDASSAAEPGGDADAVDDPDSAWDVSSLDALRADALAARILGRVGHDGTVTWDRSSTTKVVVNVVMDYDTVRAERERLEVEPSVALVDGVPVPAAIARELVEGTDGAEGAVWWRRWVVDPVDGHLMDYGTATYLPARLRRHVFVRDDVCRAPGCTVHAEALLELDHAERFPEGSSSAANCGALSTPCHQLKTAGYVDLVDSAADGSGTWVTAWGQRVTLPPRPVLPGRADPVPDLRPSEGPPVAERPPDDPPPF